MEKKVTFWKKSIKGLFLIGMAVQIVWGFCFMAANLFSVQQFADTAMYKEVSHTFLLDEYIGVLYPLILFLCPVETLVYVLQLALAFLAGCVFVCFSGLGEEKLFSGKNIFASLYLLTIPFLMQLHMAILPQSFVLSLGLIQLGLCMNVLRQKTDRPQKAFFLCCLCLVGMALLNPDYLILGCPAVLWLFFTRIEGKYVQTGKNLLHVKIYQLLVLAGSICLVLFVNGMTQTPGVRGNIQRSLGAAMVSRLAWPNFEVDYYFWPEEVKEVMDSMTGREISRYAENVKTVLGPLMEEAFGKEQANAYYWQMAMSSLFVRTKEVVGRIAEDFLAYLFTPFAVGVQLSGGGASYSGYNFSMMWQQARELTTIYVNYGVCSLLIGMVFAAAALIAECVSGKKASRDSAGKGALAKRSSSVLLCVVCVLLQTLRYTMSGTYMMDYKNVPMIIVLWYSCLLWGLKFYGIHTKDT